MTIIVKIECGCIDAAHGTLSSHLMRVKAASEGWPDHLSMEWQTIATAPFDRDLELAVIDTEGPHALVFPCRRVLRGWAKADTHSPVNVHPTHWRVWEGSISPLFARRAAS